MDHHPVTAHDIAAQTPGEALPVRVRQAGQKRAESNRNHRSDYERWDAAVDPRATATREARAHDADLSRSSDHGSTFRPTAATATRCRPNSPSTGGRDSPGRWPVQLRKTKYENAHGG